MPWNLLNSVIHWCNVRLAIDNNEKSILKPFIKERIWIQQKGEKKLEHCYGHEDAIINLSFPFQEATSPRLSSQSFLSDFVGILCRRWKKWTDVEFCVNRLCERCDKFLPEQWSKRIDEFFFVVLESIVEDFYFLSSAGYFSNLLHKSVMKRKGLECMPSVLKKNIDESVC